VKERRLHKCTRLSFIVALLFLFLVGCGQGEQLTEPPTADSPAEIAPTEDAAAETDASGDTTAVEAGEPIRIESNGEVPFYARFGENETFSNGEWTTIIFYRQPDCIPDDFNLNQFFHFPGENDPGAFACAPPTTTSIETWANGPETDPAPLVAEMTGRGAVPVWFFAQSDIEAAMEDGIVTIGELEALPSRRAGTASTYTELLHPSQSNAQTLIQFKAEGALEDGGPFMVDVSFGAPDVDNHVTIAMDQ